MSFLEKQRYLMNYELPGTHAHLWLSDAVSRRAAGE